ncbi:aminopeptidase [Gracilinema caldarium]|uniref:aminopeptidase n=1 Tax=Gracilinema caldarium TaxID=215591 RepID=UPI0026EDCD11|nr:aminopeptidase [Gracilinema caldarium]
MSTTYDDYFGNFISQDKALQEAARIAIEDSLQVKKNERVLIVSNPRRDVSLISQALFDAAIRVGAKPVLIYQPVKTQMDFADPMVLAAFQAKPAVFISMSAEKLGKDEAGIARPYQYKDTQFDHIFHLQLYGEKTCRAFWSPSTNLESFIRTVPIDYEQLAKRCKTIKEILDRAVAVNITAPGGTNVRIGLKGRSAKTDDGDFSRPGTGGNLPAGETFISPENGTAQGLIAFDGSISLHDRDILIQEPIRCTLEKGYITKIEGGEEAQELLKTVTMAEQQALDYEKSGRLPAGSGPIYAKNARNIGELGIGLNPLAKITGNMLEDEKAFRTCHFAVGHNYDEDAPALIHLDGLVKNPTIVAIFADGTEAVIEKDGELAGF